MTTPAQIWLKSTGPTSAVLQATAKATVPQQNVYLYDGNSPGVNDAQRLILALDSELTTTVTANAEFKAVGSLVVQKTIAGPAAGSQGQVTIHTVCDGTALTPDFVVASGSPAGTTSRTYTGIPSGSMCTITETANGTERTTNVTVNVAGDGQQVTIPQNSTVTATVTDTYDFVPGSLTVVKNITGAGAGPARRGHHPRGLRRRAHPRLRDTGWNAGWVHPGDTRQHPGRLDVHGHRDRWTVTTARCRSPSRAAGRSRSRQAGPNSQRSPTTTRSTLARWS